jgi:hypothetical protein
LSVPDFLAVLLIDKGALYLKYELLNKTQITMGVLLTLLV